MKSNSKAECEVQKAEQEEDEVTARKRLVKDFANIVARLYVEKGDNQ